jgi:hypothetical protein
MKYRTTTGSDIDDRTAREVSAEVWRAVWDLLDDCYDMDGDTAGRIAQTASDLTELALTRKGREATR